MPPRDSDEAVSIVAHGYELMGDRYTSEAIEARNRDEHYRSFLDRCLQQIPVGGVTLDLGCGGGIVTAEMSVRAKVVGVDVSVTQLQTARIRAPHAFFVRADMRDVAFRDHSFDAVVAFWSLIHLPRELHRKMFERIRDWLRPPEACSSNAWE